MTCAVRLIGGPMDGMYCAAHRDQHRIAVSRLPENAPWLTPVASETKVKLDHEWYRRSSRDPSLFIHESNKSAFEAAHHYLMGQRWTDAEADALVTLVERGRDPTPRSKV